MFIAGCAGGGHALAPSPSAGSGGNNLGSPSGTLSNPGRVTLNIAVPVRQTQVSRRGAAGYRPTAAKRVPSWISPSTAYVGIQEMYGSQQAYFTYLALSSCTSISGSYQCSTNLQSGTYTLYLNLYDQNVSLLSTNVYSNPSPTTIYANGSPYSNNIYVTTAGVISNLQFASPDTCFAAGAQQSIPLYVLDADGNTIVGPIANPLTADFTAYNGAGLGAISLYVMYNGSPAAANTWTLTDSSIYSSPYVFVSGQEGAIYIAGTVTNIPFYVTGQTIGYTGYGGYAATGTYIAWGVDNNPYDGLYPIAIQQSINQAVTCQSANGTQSQWVYVESFLDPVTNMPYLALGDAYNNAGIIDAYSPASVAHAYNFFAASSPYGRPGPQSWLYQTYSFVPSQPFVNILTSAVWQGRIDVISAEYVDLDDTLNGAIYSDGAYGASSVAMNSSTRFAGNPGENVLYYNDIGTPFLYGFTTGSPPGSPLTPIDFSSSGYPITGQIYSVAPSGDNGGVIVVRGANSSNVFYVCAFSDASFAGSVQCHQISSTDSNPVSMQYDSGTGNIMWAGGGTNAYAFPAHAVSSSAFITSISNSSSYQIYNLAHSANRILSGLEGVPGVAGFYGGPQTSGPCNGTGEVTWLRYTGATTWTYVASMCWPNHYLTLTYP